MIADLQHSAHFKHIILITNSGPEMLILYRF